MATKNAVRNQRAEWVKAIAEGRVVRFDNGMTFRSFLTVEEAEKALALALDAEVPAEIVMPRLPN